MKILYAVSEAAPFIKTGGLADVAGSLPRALSEEGADVRVILPLYGQISEYWRGQMSFELFTYTDVSWRRQYCGLYSLRQNGVTYYFVDNETYFKRDGGIYGHFDDAERFAFFCRAVITLLDELDWRPDVISCNDWQTALIPIYLRTVPYVNDDIRSVFTIHNIEYQGFFPKSTLGDIFGLPWELYNGGILEYSDNVNLMKGAIYMADCLNTVSPSYADELRDPYYACGLHQIISENSQKLRGILNGIDYDAYGPSQDERICVQYSADNPASKAACKASLQEELGLWKNPGIPLIGCVSRLVPHKGFDIVCEAIDRIMSCNLQMVIMGMGDRGYEWHLQDMANRYPGRLSVRIMYSNEISAKIYAASDMFLMPSKSEPCGLSQMIAMRYGTVPIVRETGGLRDSVTPYPAWDSNGFSFSHYNADGMMSAIYEALHLYYNDKDAWERLMLRCMHTDFSWGNSAKQYMEMYSYVVNG